MRHFYHLYTGLPWEPIAEGHLEALRETGEHWDVTVGLVGPAPARRTARSLFRDKLGGLEFIEAEQGYEQLTLRALHRWAQVAEPHTPVLYAHSKGITLHGQSHLPGLLAQVWRESMTRHAVTGWVQCVALLRTYDAVGCHWVTPETHPGFVEAPMFGGNFWWSTAGYVAGLEEISDVSRFMAESWIGLNSPKVRDLRPGWPSLGLFAPEVLAALNPSVPSLTVPPRQDGPAV